MALEPEMRGCGVPILLAGVIWIAIAAAFYIFHGGMP